MECKYWCMKQVCGHFNRHRNTILRWIDNRQFPKPVRLGGHERGPGSFLIVEVLVWEAEVLRSHGKDERPRTSPASESDQSSTDV